MDITCRSGKYAKQLMDIGKYIHERSSGVPGFRRQARGIRDKQTPKTTKNSGCASGCASGPTDPPPPGLTIVEVETSEGTFHLKEQIMGGSIGCGPACPMLRRLYVQRLQTFKITLSLTVSNL